MKQLGKGAMMPAMPKDLKTKCGIEWIQSLGREMTLSETTAFLKGCDFGWNAANQHARKTEQQGEGEGKHL